MSQHDPSPASLLKPDASTDAQWVASGLRLRILAPLVLAVVLMITMSIGLMWYGRSKGSEAAIAQTAGDVAAMLQERSADEAATMGSIIRLLMRDHHVEAAFRARNADALLELSKPILEQLQADKEISHFSYVLPDGRSLLRVHAPERSGDTIERATLREAQRTGKPAWGNEQGALGTFALRAVHPWAAGDELLGYVELGVGLEHVTTEIKSGFGVDIFLAIDANSLDGSAGATAQAHRHEPMRQDRFGDAILLARTSAVPELVRAYLRRPAPERRGGTLEAEDDGPAMQVHAVPLQVRGAGIGDLIIAKDAGAEMVIRRKAILSLALVGVCVGGVLVLLFWVLLRQAEKDVAVRSRRFHATLQALSTEQQERQRAEEELAAQQERNQLLEARSRVVEELSVAKRTAEEALRKNEEVTAKLLDAQGQLMAAAREAGRAEIATNVLHNVGNVLNSVNVSAGVIGSALRNSRVTGLTRAVQLFVQHADNLGEFMTVDDRGRKLPAYLGALAEALEGERKQMLSELERLAKSIDHIKDIVATQQAHATAATVIEPLQPSELAEEALRMQGSALARHDVSVVRNYEPMDPVPLDRGRVLQILVNLISNAKAAMAEQGNERPREIKLQVRRDGPNLVFQVRDEGEGISAENLKRIFRHGFTTRKTGHGFGLHSSALAARDMGGSLSAASAGVGEGATFTLELPLNPSAAPASGEPAAVQA